MDKPQILEHIQHGVNYTLFGGRWVPSSNRCVLFGQHARASGALQVMAMRSGKLELITEVCLSSFFAFSGEERAAGRERAAQQGGAA